MLYFVDPKTKQDMVDLELYYGDVIQLAPFGRPEGPSLGWVGQQAQVLIVL
jgi:hypothetical protein